MEEKCYFCGKCRNEVDLLIRQKDIYICNECVDVCNQIIFKNKVVKTLNEYCNLLNRQFEINKGVEQ